MESLKEKTARGLLWGGLSNGVQQLLSLVFGVCLARLLSQSDYGLVGMLTIFSLMASSLQEGGFVAALNRKKEVGHNDYNAVFWTTTLVSLALYLLLFVSAPLIAHFYGEPRLTALARYVFISFFVTSLGIAPRALLFRNMMVRQSSLLALVSLVVAGVVGVAMAAMGFAYWGIATQTLVYVALTTALTFYYARWHPTLPIDFSPVKGMVGFSSKLVVTNLVSIVNNNVFSVILGRLYSAHVVGNYTQANKWNYMGWSLISNMLYGIAQPVFAQTSGEKTRQRQIFRKLLRFTALVSFPVMLGLALVSREFIVVLLGQKWEESARLLQWLCVAGAFSPIASLQTHLLISRGRSTVYMWCSIALCVAQIVAVTASASGGVERMIQVYVCLSTCWLLVWHHFVSREIGLRLWEVVGDLAPYLAITLVLVAAAARLTATIDSPLAAMVAKVVGVAGTYCLLLWQLRSTIFREAVSFFLHRGSLTDDNHS